jgi:hypothetical protein
MFSCEQALFKSNHPSTDTISILKCSMINSTMYAIIGISLAAVFLSHGSAALNPFTVAGLSSEQVSRATRYFGKQLT